mgnify:CR=1 FL=1
MSEYILEMKNISKRFGGIHALNDVNLQLRRGEVLCLCGENGAGKSTLMKILAGIQQPSEGQIYIDGQPVRIRKPIDSIHYGVSMVQQELIQIDTTNILFICGGAFDGLEKIIETRMDQKAIGFNADIKSKNEYNIGDVLKHALPQDFVKFGLIPEFIGRVPVTVSLDMLDRDALIRILKEPKNALTRQYEKLFELDGVKLAFDADALEAIADKALERKTGARGLRAIMEAVTLDLMYHIPSDESITECEITKDLVEEKLSIEEQKLKTIEEK